MKVTLIFRAFQIETIDLIDYGYASNIKFEDLTEQQQQEITNSIVESKLLKLETFNSH